MQSKFSAADDNGVPRIGASTVSHDNITLLGKDINNLAFSLIAPL
jgi:hypothetical protein